MYKIAINNENFFSVSNESEPLSSPCTDFGASKCDYEPQAFLCYTYHISAKDSLCHVFFERNQTGVMRLMFEYQSESIDREQSMVLKCEL